MSELPTTPLPRAAPLSSQNIAEKEIALLPATPAPADMRCPLLSEHDGQKTHILPVIAPPTGARPHPPPASPPSRSMLVIRAQIHKAGPGSQMLVNIHTDPHLIVQANTTAV